LTLKQKSVAGGHPMKCERRTGLDDGDCKVLPFRRRDGVDAKEQREQVERDINRLLDLSRYEDPKRNIDEYKARMVENMAAVVVLSVLVAVAALDIISLEQLQHCAYATAC
jgi:hypothetical protein